MPSLCMRQYLQTEACWCWCWAKTWQLEFNIDKCVIIPHTRSLSPIKTDYRFKDNIIKNTSKH